MLHPELSAYEDVKTRFLREGYAANSVKHPGAVMVVDDDVAEDGAAFLPGDGAAPRRRGRRLLDAVGATAWRGRSSTALSSDGEDAGANLNAKGAAYIYAFTAATSSWTPTAYKPSNTTTQMNLYFGEAVALSSDNTTLAVGATGDSSSATGIPSVDAGPDAGQNSTGAGFSGAVYVFH